MLTQALTCMTRGGKRIAKVGKTKTACNLTQFFPPGLELRAGDAGSFSIYVLGWD